MADSLTQADGATDYIAAERGHTDTWSEILVGHETSIAKSANRVIVIFFAIGNGRIITFAPPRSHVQKGPYEQRSHVWFAWLTPLP